MSLLRVRPAPWAGNVHSGFISIGSVWYACAIGRNGVTRKKREGDGASPVGEFSLVGWRFQPVAPGFPRGSLPARAIRRDDGWCDDPRSGAYNRQVRLPFSHGHESLWRDDGKYAVVGVLDYNLRARARGAGSAIFFHLCDDKFGPTAGCIAVLPRDMRKILPRISRRTRIKIG